MAARFGLILLLVVIVAGVGLRSLSVLNDMDDVVHVNNVQSNLAGDLRIAINQIGTTARDIVLVTDEATMQALSSGLQKAMAGYAQADEAR